MQVSTLQPNIPHVLVHVDGPILLQFLSVPNPTKTQQIVLQPLTFKALYGKLVTSQYLFFYLQPKVLILHRLCQIKSQTL